jgi:hypothetical protein
MATLRCCCSRRSDALSPELPGGARGDGRDLLSRGGKFAGRDSEQGRKKGSPAAFRFSFRFLVLRRRDWGAGTAQKWEEGCLGI